MLHPRRQFMALTTLALSCIVTTTMPSRAQTSASNYPTRPITIVVPFAAGGQTDIIARVVAQSMSEEIGQRVVVENKPGAGGAVGIAFVSRAAPDGHTILAMDISFTALPHIQANAGYTLSDFRAVGPSSRGALGMVVAPGDPSKNANDFIARSAGSKEEVTFGHSGVGSTPHLAALSFANATNIRPLMVSYGGMSPVMNDIAGDRVTVGFAGPAIGAGMAQEKMLKLYAVTGDQRVDSAPDVPTLAELGVIVPGFEKGTWYGLMAPGKTPDAIIAKLNSALQRAMSRPEVAAQLKKNDVYPWVAGPQEFGSFVAAQTEVWKGILAKLQK